jgi:hypothetical protein
MDKTIFVNFFFQTFKVKTKFHVQIYRIFLVVGIKDGFQTMHCSTQQGGQTAIAADCAACMSSAWPVPLPCDVSWSCAVLLTRADLSLCLGNLLCLLQICLCAVTKRRQHSACCSMLFFVVPACVELCVGFTGVVCCRCVCLFRKTQTKQGMLQYTESNLQRRSYPSMC